MIINTRSIYTIVCKYMGREIIATEHTARCVEERGHNIEDVFKAMHSIIETGQNIEQLKDVLVLTSTGWVLVFCANIVHDAIKPEDARAYFDEHTNRQPKDANRLLQKH